MAGYHFNFQIKNNNGVIIVTRPHFIYILLCIGFPVVSRSRLALGADVTTKCYGRLDLEVYNGSKNGELRHFVTQTWQTTEKLKNSMSLRTTCTVFLGECRGK